MSNLFLSIASLFSGICASLGLGGGFVLLLYLTLFTSVAGSAARLLNLLFFLPVALLSLFFHFKNKLIEKTVLFPFISGGLIGAAFGAFLSVWLDPTLLSKVFALLILFLGGKDLWVTIMKHQKNRSQKK